MVAVHFRTCLWSVCATLAVRRRASPRAYTNTHRSNDGRQPQTHTRQNEALDLPHHTHNSIYYANATWSCRVINHHIFNQFDMRHSRGSRKRASRQPSTIELLYAPAGWVYIRWVNDLSGYTMHGGSFKRRESAYIALHSNPPSARMHTCMHTHAG